MEKPIEGKPAFPNGPSGMSIHYDDGHVEHQYPGCEGMSLRQWYIGKALQGFCANPDLMHHVSEGIARLAIEHADAVMSILYPQSEKEPNQ